MKELFKKVFSEKTSSPIFVGVGTFSILTFIVFPGLTVANTILNILSGILGLFVLIFVYYYINMDKFVNHIINFESGETDLDYMNPNELKKNKKHLVKSKTSINNKKSNGRI